MTLEQLRIFVAVAEREHVTRAAQELRLTQSAVSAAVTALETRHAVTLFDRIGRRIVLTETGRLFLAEARAVLARAAAAEALLADIAGLSRGRLALAASQTVASYWLPPLLQRFRAAHPGIRLEVAIGNTEQVATLVHDGAVDLGFVEGEVADDRLAASPVATDEMVLVTAPPGVPPADGPVGAGTLRRLCWVTREPGSGTRAALEAVLGAHDIGPEAIEAALVLPSNEAVRAAVEAGAGAAVLSRLVVAASLAAGTLVALDLPLPQRAFILLRHRERATTRAARAFLDLVEGGRPAAG